MEMNRDIVEQIEERLRHPDRAMIRKIREQSWTHNIPLSQEDSTCGMESPTMDRDMRVHALRQHARPFPGNDFQAIRALDLGSFEGGIAFEMARLGMDVTGIEGRESNYLKSKMIEDYFGLPNLRFIHDDVSRIGPHLGEFQLVLCCGVLYHMENPFDFLRKIAGILQQPGMLFLDTHYAPSEEMLKACTFKASLSSIDCLQDEGHSYSGRWYSEGREHPWAALSNERSFWPVHRSLVEGLSHGGFAAIYELFGSSGYPIEEENAIRENLSRSFFIALKSA
jgi:2-polyprenyl-3-methyl-5-hydroxy-6-metoxy-1,4-benzoquinol methylase